METKRWNVMNQETISEATTLLNKGLTVAFPTETVYGLGADATNADAVNRIFQAKGRPQDNPLIAHVSTKEQLLSLVTELPHYAEQLMNVFSPGPITFILPSNDVCAPNVTAGLDTVAIRIPDHPVAQQLLNSFNHPIAAPSANLSGKPSPTTADHVWNDLAGKIAGLLDGGPTGVGMESTVIDCTGSVPIILRPGAITEEQVREIVGNVKIVYDESQAQGKSPGTKYKHYTPEVPLWIVSGSVNNIQSVIDTEREQSKKVGILARTSTTRKLTGDISFPLGDDPKEIARNLYNGLRSFTRDQVDLIVCESLPETGLGKALMNRMTKAASKIL